MNFKRLSRMRSCFMIIPLMLAYNNLSQAQSRRSIHLKGKKEIAGAFGLGFSKQQDISVQLKYFASKHIGLGAELMLTDLSGRENHGYIINSLFEVVFSSTPGLIPYLNTGFGVARGGHRLTRFVREFDGNITLGILNVGGGLKLSLAKRVLAKAEVRYQTPLRLDVVLDSGIGAIDLSRNYLSVLFGLSFLL